MAETIQTNHKATIQNWNKKVFNDYLRGSLLEPFMGSSDRAIIQILPEVETGSGDKFTFHFRPQIDRTKGITGSTALKGTEEDLSIYTDTIVINEKKKAIAVRNFDISQKRVALDLEEQQYQALKDWMSEGLHYDIMLSLLDTSQGRTQARYLYGKEANWNNDINIARNAIAAADKLTPELLTKAKHKAQLEGGAKIRPANITSKEGFPVEQFVFLGHPYTIRDLVNSSEWQNREYNNNIASSARMGGAMYKGSYDGVAVYELPDDVLVEKRTTGGDICHNLLLGAQAACIGYGMRPDFRFDNDDYDTVKNLAVIEIRGQKKTVFNNEDFGIVHIYTNISK